MQKVIALFLFFIVSTGCSHRVMIVQYGVDTMSPYDREIVVDVLNTHPDGRRWSWTNKASGYQYTMTPVNRYFIEDDLMCRSFLIDSVWPIRSENRRHKQTRHRACQNYDKEWIMRECETLGECLFK